MKNQKRFRCSQNAHKRLEKYHKRNYEKNGDDTSFIKMNYHSHIQNRQAKAKKVFTKDERQRIYNDVVCTFF